MLNIEVEGAGEKDQVKYDSAQAISPVCRFVFCYLGGF